MNSTPPRRPRALSFPPKDLHYRFLSRVKPVYYLRHACVFPHHQRPLALRDQLPGAYLPRVSRAPWQVMVKQNTGELVCVAEDEDRFTLGEAKEEMLIALGLADEDGSTMKFLRAWYKTNTWWEEDSEGVEQFGRVAHVDGRLVRYVKGGWRGGGCDVSSHIDVAGGLVVRLARRAPSSPSCSRLLSRVSVMSWPPTVSTRRNATSPRWSGVRGAGSRFETGDEMSAIVGHEGRYWRASGRCAFCAASESRTRGRFGGRRARVRVARRARGRGDALSADDAGVGARGASASATPARDGPAPGPRTRNADAPQRARLVVVRAHPRGRPTPPSACPNSSCLARPLQLDARPKSPSPEARRPSTGLSSRRATRRALALASRCPATSGASG